MHCKCGLTQCFCYTKASDRRLVSRGLIVDKKGSATQSGNLIRSRLLKATQSQSSKSERAIIIAVLLF